jgi:hypothetical protein
MNVELLSRDWARFAEKIRQNGYVFLQAANPKLVVTDKGAADPNIISATLLCRSLTHLKAVPILLEEGLVVEARTIVRNCFENAFWLAAIHSVATAISLRSSTRARPCCRRCSLPMTFGLRERPSG